MEWQKGSLDLAVDIMAVKDDVLDQVAERILVEGRAGIRLELCGVVVRLGQSEDA